MRLHGEIHVEKLQESGNLRAQIEKDNQNNPALLPVARNAYSAQWRQHQVEHYRLNFVDLVAF